MICPRCTETVRFSDTDIVTVPGRGKVVLMAPDGAGIEYEETVVHQRWCNACIEAAEAAAAKKRRDIENTKISVNRLRKRVLLDDRYRR